MDSLTRGALWTLKHWNDNTSWMCNEEAESIKTVIEKLKNALAFYANEKNYSVAYQTSGEIIDDAEINKDKGFRAQQVLEEQKTQ